MLGHTTHITLLTRLADSSDEVAWREFHERYGELIRAFARIRGVHGADADDVVQDVLMNLTKAMSNARVGGGGFQYDPGKGKFRSYLKTVVLHAIARRSRQNRAGAPLEPIEATVGDGGDSEHQWEHQWRQHHTRLAMKQIESEFNATDIEAFKRYAVLQHEAAVVAEALGISVDSVYQAKSRVLKRLTSVIERQIEEEG